MTGNDRGQSRQLFKPWLIEQINSKKYEGLYWVDDRHTMFRIPWKHLSRKDSNPKDYEIFKAWAIEGGKCSDQCEDPTIWKTNFRCALNSITVNKKNVFTEVANKSSDLHDPHKVYRINYLQGSAAASSHFFENHNGVNSEEDDNVRLRISPDTAPTVNFTQPVYLLKQVPIEVKMQGLSLKNHLPECSMAEEMAIIDGHYHRLDFLEKKLFQPIYNASVQSCGQDQVNPEEKSSSSRQDTWKIHLPLPAGNQFPEMLLSSSHENGQNVHPFHGSGIIYGPGNGPPKNNYPSAEAQWAVTQHSPLQNGFSLPPMVYAEERSLQGPNGYAAVPGQTHNLGSIFPILEVTIYYKGRLMTCQRVNSPCLLSSSAVPDPSVGHFSTICFPSPNELPDQKQVQYTSTLLENVERGLLLEVEQGALKMYATRRDKCKVYWAFSKQLENPAQSMKFNMLQRGERTEIFNFDQFWMELRDYKAGRRESPDYTLYLCFGQCFSEQNKTKEKKLILVKIVPQFCAELHDLMQREGASSLNSESLSLQISSSSNSSLYDLIDSCELMDIDFSHSGSLFTP